MKFRGISWAVAVFPLLIIFSGLVLGASAAFRGWPAWVILVATLLIAGGGLWNNVGSLLANSAIAASITGGDSFCYVTVFDGDRGTRPLFGVIHQGKHPLYDVQIQMVELSEEADIGEGETVTYEEVEDSMKERRKVFQLGNLSPGTAVTLGRLELPDTQQQNYNVFIRARNGSFRQPIRLRRVNGGWKLATKVMKDYESQVLLNMVQPEFPLDEKGRVQW